MYNSASMNLHLWYVMVDPHEFGFEPTIQGAFTCSLLLKLQDLTGGKVPSRPVLGPLCRRLTCGNRYLIAPSGSCTESLSLFRVSRGNSVGRELYRVLAEVMKWKRSKKKEKRRNITDSICLLSSSSAAVWSLSLSKVCRPLPQSRGMIPCG